MNTMKSNQMFQRAIANVVDKNNRMYDSWLADRLGHKLEPKVVVNNDAKLVNPLNSTSASKSE